MHSGLVYKRGYASKLILSGATSKKSIYTATKMRQIAIENSISSKNIIIEEKAKNTYENALFVKEIVKKKSFFNLILLTSPYHQRRVYETFKKVFEGTAIHLQNAPSIYSPWQYHNWWKSITGIKLTASEYIKIFFIKAFGVYRY